MSRQRRSGPRSALTIAGYRPDAVYAECVRVLSQADICPRAPFEAKQRRDVSAVQQAARDGSSRFTLPFHHGDKDAYARSAMRLEHPASVESVDLPPDAVCAISFTVARRHTIAAWRLKRLGLLRAISARLEPMSRCMQRDLTPQAAAVVGNYHLALFACIIDAFKYPDVFFVRRLMYGFPGYGALTPTGVYPGGGW